jgi:serine/threonine protein phosphatase PrpC
MYYFYGKTEKGSKSHINKDCFLIDDTVMNSGFKKRQTKNNGFVVSVTDGVGSSLYGGFASQYILTQISNRRKLLSRALIMTIINNANSYLIKE